MHPTQTQGILMILCSVLIALILTIIPLPSWALPLRPVWAAMVLLYWIISLPYRIGVGVAWILGITLDALQNTLLGEQALAMTIIAFIAIKMQRQLRVFPLWQQAMCVMILIAVYQFIRFWVQGMIGELSAGWLYWLPVITSALLWPWIFNLLREARRRFNVY